MMEKTTKTFYSVTYSVRGASGTREAWFDNKEAAEKFAAADYRDNPVAHRVSRSEKIREYNENVAMTKYELEN